MNAKLTQRQIGKRVADIRKMKGLTQEDLANQIELSRSVLVQIELGNRKLTVIELQDIACVFGLSLDELLNKELTQTQYRNSENEMEKQEVAERISVPDLQIPKFKNVLLYILEQCAGKPNVGETLLYKLLYFSDFNYYEIYEEHLTGAAYRKLPFGPVPQKIDTIIQQMIENNELQRIKTKFHNYSQTRYLPLIKPDLTQLKASEKEIIDRVIDQFSDWSASAISQYSHNDIPWKVTKEGEFIDYELSFYRETPYSVRNYEQESEE